MTETKEKDSSLALEVLDKINSLAAAGFGVVAALAWNDTIKGIFQLYFPTPEGNVWAQLLYAIVLTVLIVLITVYLARSTKKIKDLVVKEKKSAEDTSADQVRV